MIRCWCDFSYECGILGLYTINFSHYGMEYDSVVLVMIVTLDWLLLSYCAGIRRLFESTDLFDDKIITLYTVHGLNWCIIENSYTSDTTRHYKAITIYSKSSLYYSSHNQHGITKLIIKLTQCGVICRLILTLVLIWEVSGWH